jgi:hypothetical protein
MVRLNFFFLFQGVLNHAGILNGKLVADVHEAQDPSAASRLMMRHSELITAWTKRTQKDDYGAQLENQSLEECRRAVNG